MSAPSEREDKALQALITGALHPYGLGEITEAEAIEFLKREFNLSLEDEEAFIRHGGLRLTSVEQDTEIRVNEAPANYAMHREGSENALDEKNRAEIERKRHEIIERLRKLRREKQ